VFGRKKDPPPAQPDPDRKALYEQLAQRPETVCPFLGLADNRVGYVDGPSEDHRCYAYEDVSPLSTDQQRNVCLQRGYANCPRYLRGVLVIPTDELAALRARVAPAVAPAPPPPPPSARPRARSRVPAIAGVLVLLLLLGGGGWLARGILFGDANPSSSPSPSLVASASIGPSVTAGPSATPVPTLAPSPTPRVITNSGFTLIGSADNGGESVIRLTTSGFDQKGAAWSTDTINVADGFTMSFGYQISEQLGDGGDGIAVVIQGVGLAALGGVGGDLGYAGIPNSLAIEFDTFRNPELGDPSDNHVAIHTLGTAANDANETAAIAGPVTPGRYLSDGSLHHIEIRYLPGTLQVFLDGSTDPILTADVNLVDTLRLSNGQAWVGLTASTGFTAQVQQIFSISLLDDLAP
jgi:hypothetical protein